MCGTTQTMSPSAPLAPTAKRHEFVAAVAWKNAIGFLALHLIAVYAMYPILTDAHPFSYVWAYCLASLSAVGITVGAHRLFSHRSYTANFAVRAFLVFAQTVAGQNCMYIWVRDHRQHHKYSDTSADPHDSTRGFFFSHIGWLMVRKHPDVIRSGAHIDMSDLEADSIVMFQKNHYKLLYLVFSYLVPIAVACYFWNESLWYSFVIVYVYRTVLVLNFTWLVNSAAHLYGTKPYDEHIVPSENAMVSYFAYGEGWHNYHHSYPWDYRTSEFGMKFNPSATVIEWFAKMGWVTGLRSASRDVVMAKVARKGDGSHGKDPAERTTPSPSPPKKLDLTSMHIQLGERMLQAAWNVCRGVPFGFIFSTFLLVKYYWLTPWTR